MAKILDGVRQERCESVPGDEDMQCDVCGMEESSCVCPECAYCGVAGDPDCYTDDSPCNAKMNQVQIDSRAAADKAAQEEYEAEKAYWDRADRQDEVEEW